MALQSSDDMGRFQFDGAEGIAFWVSNEDPEIEYSMPIMFDDLDTLKAFLQHNIPGLFSDGSDDDAER